MMLSCLLLFCIAATAQKNADAPYLLVKLNEAYDKVNKTFYYTIWAEQGNPNANGLYQLVPYYNQKEVAHSGIQFYANPEGKQPPYYNYFPSKTTALNFIAQQGWSLITVINETASTAKTEWVDNRKELYTEVVSTPVYYFKIGAVPR